MLPELAQETGKALPELAQEGRVRTGQDRPGQVRTGPDKSGQVMTVR